MLSLLLLAILPVLAAPSDDAATSGEDDRETAFESVHAAPFALVLEEAKRAYFSGEVPEALRLLAVLERRARSGESVARDDLAEALIYLGEIRFNLGERDAAWTVFETLLSRYPDQSINPYHHPPEVVQWFERVRVDVVRRQPPPEPPLPPPLPTRPPPTWTYLPLGLPQFHRQEFGRGAAYGAMQLGFGLASVGMWMHLRNLNDPDRWTADQYRQLQGPITLQRYAVQWPATFAFYFTWWLSHMDARRSWQDAPPALLLEPQPGGATIGVHGRF